MAVLARGLLPIVFLGLWVYCVLDVIATDDSRVQNLPKLLWLVLVILVPLVGSIAWLLLGRPSGVGWRPGDASLRRERWSPPMEPPRPTLAPGEERPPTESREDAIRRYYEEKARREEEIHRLEEDLRADERDDPGSDGEVGPRG